MAKTKMVLLVNIPSMNALPASERWLLKDHAAETLGWIGPWLDEYVSYRVVSPPPELHEQALDHGYYNWRVTMHVYNEKPPPPAQMWTILAPMPHAARPEVDEVEEIYTVRAEGRREAPQMHVLCFVPWEPTEDFLGGDVKPWEKNILRWVQVFKYPENVSVEEGDRWYLDVHAPQVMQQPGLTRFYSFRTIDVPGESQYPWHRVTELWYEDFASWRRAVLDSPPAYTSPAWATYDRYPFLAPYVDFASTFILERPTNDFLRDNLGYWVHV